ncbi:MAG: PilZ domain-containing protein [Candidatus Omnitrophica bacterium]|nr:PilZ domain-containing protein [Candidatus Omnitrophota bacterium]MDD5500339.1 PilZ domain-containing protein [Candidatus Omnitrophota bacterium]
MLERRKLPRWKINESALLRLKYAVNDLYCQINDINHIGAQVTLHTKLPMNRIFKMNLRLSEKYTIEAKVWVAWHRVVNGSNHYGIYFKELKDASRDKINKFISAFYPNSLTGITGTEGSGSEEEVDEIMGDHRIFERFRKQVPARFIGLNGKESMAETFDVSAKGLGLSTSMALESRSNLEIWLDVPNSAEQLYTRGQVVWSKPGDDGTYKAGVELERADLMGISRLLRS